VESPSIQGKKLGSGKKGKGNNLTSKKEKKKKLRIREIFEF
jgi:hypothetical protein